MNPVCLVTGGAKRLGRAMALMLANAGYDIALHYHASEKSAYEIKSEIKALGRRCFCVQGDLRDPQFYTRCIETVTQTLGTISLLINNASIFEKICFKDSKQKTFDDYFALHLRAPLFLAQAYALNAKSGAIINMLDSSVDVYAEDAFIYTLSKKSLKDLTLLLAKTLAPGIRVNGICPGPILAPEGEGDAYLNAISEKTPMKRPGTVEDILNAVQYLMRSKYINGEILYVDGGQRLS
ncbi:MAG: SDR family oxidoreductase [Nitrospirae bacterium]|nr:SDR family oxidoreductase [Candidatus Manganitrophaceae bacterium]